MRVKFSILRLMIAVAVLATTFAFTEPLGIVGRIFITPIIGLPLAGVALFAKIREIVTVLLEIICIFAGVVIVTSIAGPSIQGYEAIVLGVLGASGGAVIAVMLSRHFFGSDKGGSH